MTVGKIILAGHSGGGTPVLRQLELIQDHAICEAWVFEGVYVDQDKWVNVIKNHSDTKFFSHYHTTAQQEEAKGIETKLKTTTIEVNTLDPIGIDGKKLPR